MEVDGEKDVWVVDPVGALLFGALAFVVVLVVVSREYLDGRHHCLEVGHAHIVEVFVGESSLGIQSVAHTLLDLVPVHVAQHRAMHGLDQGKDLPVGLKLVGFEYSDPLLKLLDSLLLIHIRLPHLGGARPVRRETCPPRTGGSETGATGHAPRSPHNHAESRQFFACWCFAFRETQQSGWSRRSA